MAAYTFIVELKRSLPESSWSWLISALRQDPIIWRALQGRLGQSALEKFSDRPQAYSPANLSLVALGYSDPEEIVKNAAYNQVPEPVFVDSASSVEQILAPELTEAGIQAMDLREVYLQAGSWQDTSAQSTDCNPNCNRLLIWNTARSTALAHPSHGDRTGGPGLARFPEQSSPSQSPGGDPFRAIRQAAVGPGRPHDPDALLSKTRPCSGHGSGFAQE